MLTPENFVFPVAVVGVGVLTVLVWLATLVVEVGFVDVTTDVVEAVPGRHCE
jgi:hypothetical protein